MAIFRYSDSRVDSITKARYHKKLGSLVKGANTPSVEDERSNPAAAEQIYTAWSTYLRINTRDTKKYALLFGENVNYGYRRNVYGLRPIGIVTTALCCGIDGTWLYVQSRAIHKVDVAAVGALAFSLFSLLLWLFRLTSEWVRVPACAYAERLAEAVDTIDGKNRSKSK